MTGIFSVKREKPRVILDIKFNYYITVCNNNWNKGSKIRKEKGVRVKGIRVEGNRVREYGVRGWD
jgi:hypothetical protein